MKENQTISIQSDGTITLEDTSTGTIHINPSNDTSALLQLRQLTTFQLDALLQVSDRVRLASFIKSALEQVTVEKNVVKGNICNVDTVRIGDELHFHYHPLPPVPKELTHTMPRLHPDDVIGRDSDLSELHSLMHDNKRVVLVNGLGGIGKTTLAQAYLSTFYDEYQHLAWITQESSSFENDFISDITLLKSLNIESNQKDVQTLVVETLTKLKAISERPNLLVIDNAEQSLSEYLDRLPSQPTWHLLVTSREEIDKLHIKKLDFLREDDAISLFKKYYTLQTLSNENIRELVILVDYHTLTIEILAKTTQVHRYSLEVLKSIFVDNLRSIARVNHSGLKPIDKIGTYLSKVFQLSQINKYEIWLLKQFVCLPSDFHKHDFIHGITTNEQSEYVEYASESLYTLRSKGWLLYNEASDSYKMHIVVKEVLKKELNILSSDVHELIINITQLLVIDQSKDNIANSVEWVSFGKSILNILSPQEDTEIADLQVKLSQALHLLGNYNEAKDLINIAISFYEETRKSDDYILATARSNLGLFLKDLGEYKQALTLLEYTTNLFLSKPSENKLETIAALSNLGLVYKSIDRFPEAIITFKKALIISEESLKSDNPLIAICCSNLASAYKDIADYEKAQSLLERAVKINKDALGCYHPSTARSMSGLALILKDKGSFDEARDMLKKVVDIDVDNFGENSIITATSYSNLASILCEYDEYQEARILFEKAVAIDNQNTNKMNPDSSVRRSNLASVLSYIGEFDQAVEIMNTVIAYQEESLDRKNSLLAISYSILASIFSDMKKYKEAKDLYLKAIHLDELIFGISHPNTLKHYSNLGVTLTYLKDYEGADKYFKKALHNEKRTITEAGLDIADILFNFAHLNFLINDYEKAMIYSQRALDIYIDFLSEEHPKSLNAFGLYSHSKNLLNNNQNGTN